MPSFLSSRIALLGPALLALAPPLHAQAGITADRPSTVSLFAEISAVHLDLVPGTNPGLTLGGLYTLHNRWRFDPSVELRGTYAPGNNISLNSGAVGFRLEHPLGRRLHLFGDLLAGLGQVNFQHPSIMANGEPYSHDGSVVFQFGGGLEVDISPSWAVQAEIQQQNWNLGPQPDVLFSPTLTSVGIIHRFSFRPYRSR